MSLEHQLPVMLKKRQMSGERAQCGLTSLLPMSCRGRAEAFARRLHTRLRNLGSAERDDAGESQWIATASAVPRRDSTDLFFDFELECESPSSPADDCDPPFPDRSPSDESDAPFYDVDSEPDAVARLKQRGRPQEAPSPPPLTNGFTFSSAFYTDRSPIKSQPAPRENGLADGRLYSAITFDDCERRDTMVAGLDEIDCAPADPSRLPVPFASTDSDSEFESARSEPVEVADEALEVTVARRSDDDDASSDRLSELSVCLEDVPAETHNHVEHSSALVEESQKETNETIKVHVDEGAVLLEITTFEVSAEKEFSPAPVEDPALLCAEPATAVTGEATAVEEEAEERPQRVRRCSSLKTGKTPPGTPGRKKIVRFADVLGLDLADVKTFMDEIPVIPKSAYEDLANADLAFGSPPVRASGAAQRTGALSLVPLFQAPRDVTEALEARCVCMEAARVADGEHLAVCGSVRVRNLDFHKTVHVRYTMDGWKTYTDLQATYAPGTCDGFSDRFQFVLYLPSISAGRRLELAVRFQCKGRQYWDNNFGSNYCFECLPLGAPRTTVASACAPAPPLHPTRDWHPSFY